jgi:PAS domain S-box-containing protein
MTAQEQIQQMLAYRSESVVDLDDVLITSRLLQRPVRQPDYQAENEALSALSQELAHSPENVLQRLCEVAIDLCHAHSAGVSIEEDVEGERIFRWRALAGEMATYLRGMMPRDFAPCGVVVDLNSPQLFTNPILHYPYIKAIEPPISEVLLIPFQVGGRPVGTVWIVSNNEGRQFDREDERVLTNLSHFAAAAYRSIQATELRSRQERTFETVLSSIVDIIYVFDRNVRFTFANQALLDLWKLKSEDVIGKTLYELHYPPERAAQIHEKIEAVFATGQQLRDEAPYTRVEGETSYYEHIFSPVFGADGQVEAVAGSTRNVTAKQEEKAEREALLEALELERSRLAELFLQTPALIAVLRGPDHIFERANVPYLQLVGHRDVVGKPLREALPEIVEQGFVGLLDEVYRTGLPYVGKDSRVLLQDENGGPLQERYLDFVYQPIRESDGSVSGIFVHGVDLTERKEALASAVQSERHLRSILESSADCIKVTDLDGNMVAMNTPGLCIMEIDDFGSVEGKKWSEFWPDESRGKAREAIAQARAGSRGHFQGYCTTAKGTMKWWDVLVTAIPNDDGHPLFLLIVSRDLTDLRETAKLVEEKSREIEELNDRLRRSMTETHHRVKNNLQLISALIELQSGTYTDVVPVSEFVRLGTNVQALGVIHDVLTRESKAGGKQDSLSVAEVLEKLLTILKQTVGHNYNVKQTIEDVRLPGRKVTSLALVTNELFSNAIKHGKGSVELSFLVRDGQAVLEVCDDGCGFSADFDPETDSNTGVSLIETVAQHDLRGTVEFANRSEGGARVTVRFPLH